MKYYYIEIGDCQNNPQVIVKVWASSMSAAEAAALRAIHQDDHLYVRNKEEVVAAMNSGCPIIDEDGEELDKEDL